MTGIRTDLAQEAHQLHRDVEGVECRDETCHGYEAHVVQVRTHEAAQALGKPVGTYVTVELDGLLRREEAGVFPGGGGRGRAVGSHASS